MVTSTRKRRKTRLSLKLGESRVTPLYAKFAMEWSPAWDSFVARFDGIPLFSVEDCDGHPTDYRVTFKCLPAEYLLGAHWATNNILKQVFNLVVRAGRTDPYIKFDVPDWSGPHPLMYQGCSFICGDGPARPETYLTYEHIGKYYTIGEQYIRLREHVETCQRLGYFDGMTEHRGSPHRLHQCLGGVETFTLFRDALLHQNYSLAFMQRLLDCVGEHSAQPMTTPVDVADFLHILHSTQIKTELFLQGSTD